MEETLKIKGLIRIECHDKFGNLKWDTGWIQNGITSAGKAQLALLAGDAAAVPFTYLALGDTATAFAVGQTTLANEITTSGLARAAATVSRVTTNVTNDTLNLTYTWTASGSKTVEEIGIFNANSAGTMLGRALTGTKTFVNTDSYTATYKVIFA